MYQKTHGFNLIELMIAVSIIAILSAFAFPIYTQHMAQARRVEAAESLEKLSLALEHYFIAHNTYQNATLEQLEFTPLIAKNNYQLMITTATDTEFTLAAQPLAAQATVDAGCGTLILDSSGKKTITGTHDIHECW